MKYLLICIMILLISCKTTQDLKIESKKQDRAKDVKTAKVIFRLETPNKKDKATVYMSDIHQTHFNTNINFPEVSSTEIKQGNNIIEVPIGKFVGIGKVLLSDISSPFIFCDDYKLPVIKVSNKPNEMLYAYTLKFSAYEQDYKNDSILKELLLNLSKPNRFKVSMKVSQHSPNANEYLKINLNGLNIKNGLIRYYPVATPCSFFKTQTFVPIKKK